MPLDLAIPMQVFTIHPGVPYEVFVCGVTERIRTNTGLVLSVDHEVDSIRDADTVIVPGFQPIEREFPEAVTAALTQMLERGGRIASVCTGAFALAAAGILNGRRATTHWRHLDELEVAFPEVDVDRDALYVDEGAVLTSAGMCCGIDLCLQMVLNDYGAAAANQVARELVAAPHRNGGQAQYTPAPVVVSGMSSLAGTRVWALARLSEPITVVQLARHAGMSLRSFMRRFADETGTTPLQWLVTARLSAARELLESTDYSIDRVARESGLGSAANLRLHFRRALSTTPTAYRFAFTNQPAPTAPVRMRA
ncbi:GlxA family transcriptional regulator (plasmid) [Rhodococcus globerulus]|uniref:GlxA family transcriptional regulator n=1 Tax=Rhodococcus globerulus TaxID=33008 RepID=UPI0039EBF32A